MFVSLVQITFLMKLIESSDILTVMFVIYYGYVFEVSDKRCSVRDKFKTVSSDHCVRNYVCILFNPNAQ